MKKRKFEIVIQGAYGEANFGDDALLHVIHKKISEFYKEEEILVICNSRPLEYSMGEFSGNSSVFWRYDVNVKNIKLWVVGGGTQVFRFKKTSGLLSRLKIIIRDPVMVLKRVWRLFYTSEGGGEKIFLGVGMGPFENGENDRIIRGIIQHNDHVFFRDSLSAKYYNDAHDKNVDHYSDICFSDDVSGFCKKRVGLNKVAIVLRDWAHSGNQFTPLQMAERLPSNIDFTFVFFGDDKIAIAECENNGIDHIKYDPSKHGYKGFLTVLSEFDMLISSRFHALVYGIMLELPVVALNIEPKLAVAAKDMGIPIVSSLDDGLNDVLCGCAGDYVMLVDKAKETKRVLVLKAEKMMRKFEFILSESRNRVCE